MHPLQIDDNVQREQHCSASITDHATKAWTADRVIYVLHTSLLHRLPEADWRLIRDHYDDGAFSCSLLAAREQPTNGLQMAALPRRGKVAAATSSAVCHDCDVC